MTALMCVAAGLAALVHLLFFAMESLWWTKPKVREGFGLSEPEAQTTKLLAFNQGFYNLFLAIGTVAGIGLCAGGLEEGGLTLVLIGSSPRLARGAFLQGIFPAIFLVLAAVEHLG